MLLPVGHTESGDTADLLDSQSRPAPHTSMPEGPNQPRGGETKCSHPGCPYKKEFSRPSELRRHMRTKHESENPLECPALGCVERQSRTIHTSFSRHDKLVAHIRSNHTPEASCACPVQGCKIMLPLGVLPYHLQGSHGVQSPRFAPGFSRSRGDILCPIWSCLKQVNQHSLQKHLMDHSPEQLTELDGLRPIRDGCQHGHHFVSTPAGGSALCQCSITNLSVRCPVCEHQSKSYDAFVAHMAIAHLIQPPHQQHAQSFYDDTISRNYTLFKGAPSTWISSYHDSRLVCCPACSFFRTVPAYSGFHHDFQLMNPQYLRPFRTQIMRLYPSFASDEVWAPVWEDLNNVAADSNTETIEK